MQVPLPGLSDHTLSLKSSASAWSQQLAALDRTLQPGTNLQTGKLRNIALKHAVPPQTAAVSLQGPATLLPLELETLICSLFAGGGGRSLSLLDTGGQPDHSAQEEGLGGELGLCTERIAFCGGAVCSGVRE